MYRIVCYIATEYTALDIYTFYEGIFDKLDVSERTLR